MFAGVKRWFIRKEPDGPPRRPQTAPEPRERQPERIRFVNEDAAQQDQQQFPDPESSPEGPPSAAPMASGVPGGPLGASYPPPAEPAYRMANPSAALKPRSAPPLRSAGMLTKGRAQSAGAKVPKRFVQPSSEFSVHTAGGGDDGDAPLASSTFPFRHGASSSSAGPIDPLANEQPSFSQTQHTRLALDPFVEADGPLTGK
eukprot:EG_transcript_15864